MKNVDSESPIVDFRIPYIICSEENEAIAGSIDFISMMASLPISITQILNPENFHVQSHRFYLQSPFLMIPIYFGKNDLSDQLDMIVNYLPMCIIFAPRKGLIRESLINKIKERSIIIYREDSTNENDSCDNSLIFSGKKDLIYRIIDIFESEQSEKSISAKSIFDSAKERLKESETILSNIFTENNFKPCRLNFNNIRQILGTWHCEIPSEDVQSKTDRGSLIVSSASLTLRAWIEFYQNDLNQVEMAPFECPTTLLITPWFTPEMLLEVAHTGLSPKETFRINKLLKKPQDPSTFLSISVSSSADETEQKTSFFAASFLAYRCDLLDAMTSLHSSFFRSPAIRSAKVGGQFNSALSIFQAHFFAKRKNWKKLRTTIEKLGKEIALSLPDDTLEFLEANENQIFCIGDLPVEWVTHDGAPLSFLYDICRIPESSLDVLANAYLRASQQPILVSKDILKKTLYVCCDYSDPVIGRSFDLVKTVSMQLNINDVQFEQCDSTQILFDLLERYKPELLIIDGHGSPSSDFTNQTDIKFKSDRLTPGMLKNKTQMPPLIILSCCATSPLFGYSDSIALAFLRAGSRSVTASVLPIDWHRAATLNIRLLNNLQMAQKVAIHKNWLSFISHALRTSVADDFLSRIKNISKSGIGTSIKLASNYHEVRLKWLTRFFQRGDRRHLYNELRNFLPSLVSQEYQDDAIRVARDMSFEPEHLYYCHLGRGDLIPFESYMSKLKHKNAT